VFALIGKQLAAKDVFGQRDELLRRLPVPAGVQQVLAKAIAWDEHERFAIMAAFKEALIAARADADAMTTAVADPATHAPRDNGLVAGPRADGSRSLGPWDLVAADMEPDRGQVPTMPMRFRDRFSNGSGFSPEMIWLPGGTFSMGSPEGVGNDNERPVHEVTLGHYAVGEHPVTVGEFRRFVEATGYRADAEKGDGAYVYDRK
jgi:formylglycine-generating enzyme required for sulfatase activity